MPRPRSPKTLVTGANWRWEEIEQAAYIYQTEAIEADDEGEVAKHGAFLLIAQKLRCTINRVRDRFNHCGPTFAGVREANGKGPKRVSSDALKDRDLRAAAADLRSLGAILMGDPAPGYSMLDRRRA